MTSCHADFWHRATEAMSVAEHDLALSPDAAASRAYYAAFYAVSAQFVLEGKSFSRHSAVEAAVHRDLVRTGLWSTDLGRTFSRLAQLRSRSDYGGSRHVSKADAEEAIQGAKAILSTVAKTHPDSFPGLDG